MASTFPHRSIRELEDRSFSLRLVAALQDPTLPESERDEVAHTLRCLEEPRAIGPLTATLEDRSVLASIREAASRTLRSCGHTPPRAAIANWFKRGDDVLRRHALLLMGREDAAVVVPIAADPAHPLHLSAIQALSFELDDPRLQALAIAALGHSDAAVREEAVDTIFWDEPVAAEGPLLRGIDDPDVAVCERVLATLAYYPSRKVLARVFELRHDGRVGEAATAAYEDLRATFAGALVHTSPAARAALLGWMAPVRDLLDLSAAEMDPSPPPAFVRPPAPSGTIAPDALIALYADPDGVWAEKKRVSWSIDLASFEESARPRLGAFLREREDPWVRELATRCLAAWGDHEGLLALARDSEFSVRKAAVYALGQLSRSPDVARFAEALLAKPGVTGAHASETLETYVAHAAPAELAPKLVQLALEDGRESVRRASMYALAKLEERGAFRILLPLLRAPPRVTWALHIALVEGCGRLGLEPGDLSLMREADNLDVRAALSSFEAPVK